jgi:hypothetical protein
MVMLTRAYWFYGNDDEGLSVLAVEASWPLAMRIMFVPSH